MESGNKRNNIKGGLRIVSIFEAMKGLLVLLTGFDCWHTFIRTFTSLPSGLSVTFI